MQACNVIRIECKLNILNLPYAFRTLKSKWPSSFVSSETQSCGGFYPLRLSWNDMRCPMRQWQAAGSSRAEPQRLHQDMHHAPIAIGNEHPYWEHQICMYLRVWIANCKSRHASHHDNVKKFTSFFEYGSYFCHKKPRWSIRCHQTIAKMNAKQKVKWNNLACGSPLGSAGLIQLKLDGLLSCQTTHLSWQAKGHEGGWRWPHKWHKMIHWKKKAYALSRPKCPRLRGCAPTGKQCCPASQKKPPWTRNERRPPLNEFLSSFTVLSCWHHNLQTRYSEMEWDGNNTAWHELCS